MTINTTQLRSLYAAATPGKWSADHDWTDGPEVTEYVHIDTGTPGHTALFDTSNGDLREVVSEETDRGARYRDVTGQANMALVAAMHEALPELLDEVEAARALSNAGPRIANMRAAIASASEKLLRMVEGEVVLSPSIAYLLATIQAGLELALEDDAR